MLLCVGTGALMVGMQWQQAALPKFSLPKLQLASPRSEPLKLKVPVTNTKIVVDLSDRRVYLYKDHKLKAKYFVAIGQAGWETPTGSFKVFQMYRNPVWQHPITGQKVPPGKKNPLGKWWIGFSTEEDLLIGFHGTDEETLLGQAVSHGCVRMKNSDVGNLYRQVSIGTPVTVKP
ncbi:L,D-transpeptidase [Phormidesmis priestleyi]